jgi:hypothetical protein
VTNQTLSAGAAAIWPLDLLAAKARLVADHGAGAALAL